MSQVIVKGAGFHVVAITSEQDPLGHAGGMRETARILFADGSISNWAETRGQLRAMIQEAFEAKLITHGAERILSQGVDSIDMPETLEQFFANIAAHADAAPNKDGLHVHLCRKHGRDEAYHGHITDNKGFIGESFDSLLQLGNDLNTAVIARKLTIGQAARLIAQSRELPVRANKAYGDMLDEFAADLLGLLFGGPSPFRTAAPRRESSRSPSVATMERELREELGFGPEVDVHFVNVDDPEAIAKLGLPPGIASLLGSLPLGRVAVASPRPGAQG